MIRKSCRHKKTSICACFVLSPYGLRLGKSVFLYRIVSKNRCSGQSSQNGLYWSAILVQCAIATCGLCPCFLHQRWPEHQVGFRWLSKIQRRQRLALEQQRVINSNMPWLPSDVELKRINASIILGRDQIGLICQMRMLGKSGHTRYQLVICEGIESGVQVVGFWHDLFV